MLIRRLQVIAALWLTAALALTLSMCAGSDPKKVAVEEGVPKLVISASPQKVLANGATTDVSVLATLADGTTAAGNVTVQVSNGSLNGGGSAASLSLGSGRASVKWSCDEKVNPACRGNHTATATWNEKTATTTVEFTAADAPVVDSGVGDTGASDAGSDAKLDAPADAPSDAKADAADANVVDAADAAPTATIALTASKPKLYAALGDSLTLTGTIKLADGGAVVGEDILFTTTGPTALSESPFTLDAGTSAPSLSATTATNGAAQVLLKETSNTGSATVVAKRTSTGQTAQLVVPVLAANTITWVSTKCAGKDCTIMGVKGSGFNETAQISFKIVDTDLPTPNPIAGIRVDFSIDAPPLGTQVVASAVTDNLGVATAVVTSGDVIGSFDVTATVATPGGPKSVDSPTIGIRGGIPTNNGFAFWCPRVNLDAYNSPTAPLKIDVSCNVKLVDRFGNAVGTGTSVNFKTEAGTIENSKATTAYNSAPGANNNNEGSAVVAFTTTGGVFPAADVAPLTALPGQHPNDRQLEPSYLDGTVTRNPRDGLVTLLAYVQGEEWFSDDNSNGTRDSGEQFVDQGEPFVDTNDNGVRDVGETAIDVNGNGSWDGPNGVWDKNTTVWAETRILYTAFPLSSKSSIIPGSFPKASVGGVQEFAGYFLDLNLNYMTSTGTTLGTEFVPPPSGRTATIVITQPLGDRYGFFVDRQLVAAPGEGACTPGTLICKHKVLFTEWGGTFGPSAVIAELKNSALATPDGGAATVRLKATLSGTTLTLESNGSIAP